MPHANDIERIEGSRSRDAISDNLPANQNIDGIPLVPEPSQAVLNERQKVDYAEHRRRLIQWGLHFGKDPDRADGYAYDTMRVRASRLDAFYRWVWSEKGRYTTALTHEDADAYMRELVYSDSSNTHKANTQKALKMLWKWKAHELHEEPWEPAVTFSNYGGSIKPRDFLTRDERTRLREVTLEYGSIPHYNSLTAKERSEWKAHLAQRFGKPKSEVGRDDFDRANGFKIPSLVWTSLDAGLRPVEVGRAKVSWVDVENAVLRIPAEESSKNTENWVVSLQPRTAEVLRLWLDERNQYEKYADTDALWLTRNGNPYNTHTLKYLLHKLCDVAQIPTENRKLTWYAIRHSVGTYMAHERGLAAAKAQLRHRSVQTTMKYDNAPVEDRRSALERMG